MNPTKDTPTPRTDSEHPYGGCDGVNPEFARELERENQKLRDAINEAIDNANGRESEWGERAETSFQILRKAIE